MLRPDPFQEFQAREIIYEARVLGDVLAAGANGGPVVVLDALRAHDEERPKEIYVALDGAEAVHGKMDEVLNAWMLRWETWLSESFAVEKRGVPEALGNLVDVREVLGSHLI